MAIPTQKQARGQITIVDLNDARSVNLFLSVNHPLTQIESRDASDNAQFSPDYTKQGQALVINPELLISGIGTAKFEGAPTWKVNNVPLTPKNAQGHQASVLEDDSQQYWSVGNTTGDNNFPLIITKNLSSTCLQYDIECEGTYTDPVLQMPSAISGKVTISRLVNSGELIFAYIKGQSFFKYGYSGPEPATIVLEAQLVRAGVYDNTDDDYTTDWFYELPSETASNTKDGKSDGFQRINIPSIADGGSLSIAEDRVITRSGNVYTVRAGNTSGETLLVANGNHLTVHPGAVDSSERFRADITDTLVGSPGQGHTFTADFKEVMDYSDPFMLEMSSTNGNVFKNGVGETTLKAQLTSGSIPVSPNKYNCTFHWYKYVNGAKEESWVPAVKISGNNQPTTVTNSLGYSELAIDGNDVSVKSTFVCEVDIR